MGYEKILRCPSGILGSRLLFASINVVLVVNWAVQLAEEARTDGVKREIAFWDGCIEVMEEQVERQGRKEVSDDSRGRWKDDWRMLADVDGKPR
jgi:hypothetical protein